MPMNPIFASIKGSVKALSRGDTPEYRYIPQPTRTLPSVNRIKELMETVKELVFPGFFGDARMEEESQEYYLSVYMEKLYTLLKEQIHTGLCFSAGDDLSSGDLARDFIERLPEIKRLLATDVKAVADGDPAATNFSEVIFCYPALQAMLHYRVAHELLMMGIPVLPRIITELAHSATGIDIHPGAQIGEYFSIDHGTGVVIGETCIIGAHVRLYQGVTLGARSFTLDEQGLPMNTPRHPILEDNVIVYSNATILGRITIGHDSVIGGNIWQTYSVPPHSRIIQKKAVAMSFSDGLGI
jgi:serine O-acetyltransferase